VSRYRGKGILIPEDKDQKSVQTMISVLSAQQVDKDQVLIQSFSLDSVKAAAAAGFQSCYLSNGPGVQMASSAPGVGWAGVAAYATDTELRGWVASGIRVLVWTVNRRYQRDAKLALGVKGFFSDDPAYLAANSPSVTVDRFSLQTWSPGMLGSSGDIDVITRGKFLGGDSWGYDHLDSGYAGCLQGYLCPIKGLPQPNAYTLQLNVRFGRSRNGDVTRWASAFVGLDDKPFLDQREDSAGHHFLFRKDGTLEIYKKTSNQSAVLLATKRGTAIADSEEVTYRVRVESESITLSRMNSDGSESYSVAVQDRASRGAYLHLGRDGLACGFRKISIS
jgi:hypothetical protein